MHLFWNVSRDDVVLYWSYLVPINNTLFIQHKTFFHHQAFTEIYTALVSVYDPESINLSSKVFDAGCGKDFTWQNFLELNEIYQPHFCRNDVENIDLCKPKFDWCGQKTWDPVKKIRISRRLTYSTWTFIYRLATWPLSQARYSPTFTSILLGIGSFFLWFYTYVLAHQFC